MNNVFFGLGFEFDDGTRPGVAINRSGRVVEVHKNEAGYALYARTGAIDKATVKWNDMGSGRKAYTDGNDPACALSNDVIVEVHKNQMGNTLYSMVGLISGTSISWGKSRSYETDGVEPAVATNDSGLAVSVFRQNSGDEVRYRVGQTNTSKKEVDFGGRHFFGNGEMPMVAMNASRQVVAVWAEKGTLKLRVGPVNGDNQTIAFGNPQDFGSGKTPAVALTDDGFVVVVCKAPTGVDLRQRTGTLDVANKKIDWIEEWRYFDDGTDPVCAAAGAMSVEMHRGEALPRLWYATSIITDRANWMGQRVGQLGKKPIKELAIPASHDSGMYTGGFSTIAKTQELSIYGQLANGIRYFDLRPGYDKRRDTFYIQHGGVAGPDLAQVLDDMRRFALEGHKEVWIIDFSHFDNFGKTTDSTVYTRFVEDVTRVLDPWIYKNKPADLRLAEIPLGDYIEDGPKIIVTVADEWAVLYKHPGFWVFRGSDTETAAEGDLRVFDQYSKTEIYDKMRNDQVKKYETYTGKCIYKGVPGVDCDLFLFSFTLTPLIGTGVWFHSKDPSRKLGNVVKDLATPNGQQQFLNMLYVDYCEFARVCDVALFTNNTPYADAKA